MHDGQEGSSEEDGYSNADSLIEEIKKSISDVQ